MKEWICVFDSDRRLDVGQPSTSSKKVICDEKVLNILQKPQGNGREKMLFESCRLGCDENVPDFFVTPGMTIFLRRENVYSMNDIRLTFMLLDQNALLNEMWRNLSMNLRKWNFEKLSGVTYSHQITWLKNLQSTCFKKNQKTKSVTKNTNFVIQLREEQYF